jgi:hypothetical protein
LLPQRSTVAKTAWSELAVTAELDSPPYRTGQSDWTKLSVQRLEQNWTVRCNIPDCPGVPDCPVRGTGLSGSGVRCREPRYVCIFSLMCHVYQGVQCKDSIIRPLANFRANEHQPLLIVRPSILNPVMHFSTQPLTGEMKCPTSHTFALRISSFSQMLMPHKHQIPSSLLIIFISQHLA